MNRKMTITLEAGTLAFARDFSRRTNQPVSKIIENYFQQLRGKISAPAENPPVLSPATAELYGILGGVKVPDKKFIRREFHEKNLA
ncbi:hypothetical protein FACS1894139_00950 [Planctomycetales bacterium]|nr:hypothetical protein FACS1894107_06590 [Planctomycetales bacterium]GHT02562.1 hypothetical protein FACS1894139_00950 [Planctomycetales bacterium]